MSILTEVQAQRLFDLLVAEFRTCILPTPSPNLGETPYTKEYLAPVLANFIEGLNFSGLVPHGTGGASVHSANVLGCNFYPDLAVSFQGTPVVALEVKVLKGAQWQSLFETAAGQALLYRQRYPHVALLCIYIGHKTISEEDIRRGERFFTAQGLPLILRAHLPRNQSLAPHP